ncbi:hypothetical protein BDW59DRAFT_165304 [Aspergillus cavernicola]|uniref:GPI anchored protein n=1 Tax=Aspergillus cavernicola TaxID=176166 RepID=A0ABR4HTD9_9EURO
MVIGPRTFSWVRPGGGADHTLIDECMPLGGSGMQCTIREVGGMDTTLTTTYAGEEIYTVTMGVVSPGAENTAMPTITEQPYLGCPNAWQQCGGEPWCCPETATICTTALNSHEACASVLNEELPQPAIPYFSTMGPPPGATTDSKDGAGPFAAQPTHFLMGALAGLGLALL